MKRAFFILAFAISFWSCTKENSDTFYPYPDNLINDTAWTQVLTTNAQARVIPDLFSVPTILDSVNISTGGSIRISELLEIQFPASGCLFTSGSNVGGVCSGIIKVEVTHLRKKGDMVRNAKPTTSFGKILITGSAFSIRAFQNGQTLGLAPGKEIKLSFKEPSPVNDMRVFYGVQNLAGTQPAGTNPEFTWTQSNDSSRVSTFTRTDTLQNVIRGYDLWSRKLNWINCDYFYDTTQPRTRINVLLSPNFTNNNTMVYAVFKDLRSVVMLNAEFSSRSFTTFNMPIGKSITLVSISKIGDSFFLGKKEVLISSGMASNLQPEKKTKAEIISFLDGL